MGGDALTTDECWAIAGDSGHGTLAAFSPDPRKNPAAQPVVEGYEPEGYTLYTYAAIQVWAQAVEAAGTPGLASVIEQLRVGPFDTVLGAIEFDDQGDTRGPDYVMYRWSDGQLEELARRVRIEARAFVPGSFVRSRLGPCDGGGVHRGASTGTARRSSHPIPNAT